MSTLNMMKDYIRDIFTRTQYILDLGMWVDGHVGEGMFIEWFDNGEIYWISNYKNGMYDGEYKKYNGDGSLWDHSWFEKDEEVADFLEHPELKKEYGL